MDYFYYHKYLVAKIYDIGGEKRENTQKNKDQDKGLFTLMKNKFIF